MKWFISILLFNSFLLSSYSFLHASPKYDSIEVELSFLGFYELSPADGQFLFTDRSLRFHPLNAISFKLQNDNRLLRLTGEFREITKEFKSGNFYKSKGRYLDYTLKFGFEYQFESQSLHGAIPYLSVDLLIKRSTSFGTFGGGQDAKFFDYTSNRQAFGGGFGMGIKMRIHKILCLGIESGFEVYKSSADQTIAEIDATPPNNNTENIKKILIKANPLSRLSLIYKF